jgi:integrase
MSVKKLKIRGKLSANFYAVFKIKGKLCRISTGETVKRKAEAVERRIRSKIEAGTKLSKNKITFSTALIELAAWDVERAEAETTERNAYTLEKRWYQALRFFGEDFDALALTTDKIQAYIKHRRQTCEGQTIRRELWMLKRGLGFLKSQAISTGNRDLAFDLMLRIDDFPTVKSGKKDEALAGKLHDPETLARFFDALPQHVADIFRFSMLTGLRHEELKRVKREWIKQIRGINCLIVPAQSTKSREERAIPLNAEALEIIERGGPDHIFSQSNHKKLVYAACERLGIESVTLRDMRHHFATATEQIDPKAAQDILGHKSRQMTDRYLHTDLERLAAAVEGAEISNKRINQAEIDPCSPVQQRRKPATRLRARSSAG